MGGTQRVKVGIVGCGNISSIYFINLKRYPNIEVAACADLDVARAQARAAEYDVPKACTVEELLADPQIEIVVNLTIPRAHAEVCLQAVRAGKHVYTEKPLTVTREEGKQLLEEAARRGVRVASAPETFMGGGHQTAARLVREGAIGQPLSGVAFMLCPGHEGWHPDPAFYYDIGGGPMFDMGPYYLTALVNMLGPIRRISGEARVSLPQRRITSKPKHGQIIDVKTPTHVAGTLEFANGAIVTMITSFDVFGGHSLPNIEVYGTEGTIRVPDPNGFGGDVLLMKPKTEATAVPPEGVYTDNNRGVGVMDLAYAIRSGRPHRAHGDMAYHVLEAMHAFHDAAKSGAYYTMRSTCEQPAPMPDGEMLK